jgi:hypothetical protein
VKCCAVWLDYYRCYRAEEVNTFCATVVALPQRVRAAHEAFRISGTHTLSCTNAIRSMNSTVRFGLLEGEALARPNRRAAMGGTGVMEARRAEVTRRLADEGGTAVARTEYGQGAA